MAQTDITQHGDDELIDVFINDEYLNEFAAQCDTFDELAEMASELFIYDAEQAGTFKDYYENGNFEG